MAIKKRATKKRAIKKQPSMTEVIETLQSTIKLSTVNKEVLSRLNRSEKSETRLGKQLLSASEQLEKAKNAQAKASTPKMKATTRERVNKARDRIKALSAEKREASQARTKAERLARTLSNAHAKETAKFHKAYIKAATAVLKASDQPARRRRRLKAG
ncbi:MAG: hypothetical protein ABW140_08450 [Candidatus Sedimenticola sp. 6PFRAG1]